MRTSMMGQDGLRTVYFPVLDIYVL